jgi:hypothetical protein
MRIVCICIILAKTLVFIAPRSPEAGVGAVGGKKFIMRAPFRDSSIINDSNHISVMCSLETMRNCDDGTALEHGPEGGFKMFGSLLIE